MYETNKTETPTRDKQGQRNALMNGYDIGNSDGYGDGLWRKHVQS